MPELTYHIIIPKASNLKWLLDNKQIDNGLNDSLLYFKNDLCWPSQSSIE